jgi:hypothetical protein
METCAMSFFHLWGLITWGKFHARVRLLYLINYPPAAISLYIRHSLLSFHTTSDLFLSQSFIFIHNEVQRPRPLCSAGLRCR